jgi:hypothetical protein
MTRLLAIALALAHALALAEEPGPANQGHEPDSAADTSAADRSPVHVPTEAETDAEAAYAPPPSQARLAPPLRITGYLDAGFARATGDGSSFHPRDDRVPLDYVNDAFAPAVNSRGDVASAGTGGRFTNGFLPRSMDIGAHPSFFVSTVDLDVHYTAPSWPLLLFARAQLLPRLADGSARLIVEQAFARWSPFAEHELALFAGKFDSVFGIEYLDNQANLRTGITPSLVARYTTGPSTGAKLFYRFQIEPLWSALTLNAAATNSGSFIEALQPAEISLTGLPIASARAGYELNLPGFQLKLGGSGMIGPRNDQGNPAVLQRALGADLRLYLFGLQLGGEWVWVDQDEGGGDKQGATLVSAFTVRGGYAFAAYGVQLDWGPLQRVTIYGRYGIRNAWFRGTTRIWVDRITAGLRLDLMDSLAVKVEGLLNRELDGAPTVDNDVITSSVVLTY